MEGAAVDAAVDFVVSLAGLLAWQGVIQVVLGAGGPIIIQNQWVNWPATYFLSTASQESGAGNNGWKGYVYSNPQVDMFINQGRSTFDPAQRATIYQSLCKVLADDMPWNVMWQTTRYWIVNNKIQNFQLTPAPGGGSYYDAAETWSKVSSTVHDPAKAPPWASPA